MCVGCSFLKPNIVVYFIENHAAVVKIQRDFLNLKTQSESEQNLFVKRNPAYINCLTREYRIAGFYFIRKCSFPSNFLEIKLPWLFV